MDLIQYQIVLVNLDPTLGSEIQKTRPCIIISPNELNKYLKTIVIAPMTSSSKNYPTRIEINHDKKTGWIVIDQIRTVDKVRVVKVLGNLTEKDCKKVKDILRETFVD